MPRGRSSLARPTRAVDSRLTGIASRRVTALSRHATYGGGDVPLTRDRAPDGSPSQASHRSHGARGWQRHGLPQVASLRFQIADYREIERKSNHNP